MRIYLYAATPHSRLTLFIILLSNTCDSIPNSRLSNITIGIHKSRILLFVYVFETFA